MKLHLGCVIYLTKFQLDLLHRTTPYKSAHKQIGITIKEIFPQLFLSLLKFFVISPLNFKGYTYNTQR